MTKWSRTTKKNMLSMQELYCKKAERMATQSITLGITENIAKSSVSDMACHTESRRNKMYYIGYRNMASVYVYMIIHMEYMRYTGWVWTSGCSSKTFGCGYVSLESCRCSFTKLFFIPGYFLLHSRGLIHSLRHFILIVVSVFFFY